jgi:hypothetical protein
MKLHANVAIFILCALLCSSTANAQQPQSSTPDVEPDYRVRVRGYFDSDALQDFGRRVQGYVELRNDLQTGIPTLKITIDPDEIERAEKLLARRIRKARAAAKRGDILAPPIAGQIKKMLVVEVDAKTLAAIMDDNPGEFRFRLNGTYPKDRPLSTVPPNLLALLPALADEVEYRFIGRNLILRDTRANIVIDTIPYALECTDCDDDDDDHDHDDDRDHHDWRP